MSSVIKIEARGLRVVWTVEQSGGELRVLLYPGGDAVFDANCLTPLSVRGVHSASAIVDGHTALFDLFSGYRLKLTASRGAVRDKALRLLGTPGVRLELQVYAPRLFGMGWQRLASVSRFVEVA